MLLVQHHDRPLDAQHLEGAVGRLARRAGQREVELAGFQHLDQRRRHRLDELDLDAGIALAEGDQRLGHEARRGRVDRPDPQHLARGERGLAHGAGRMLHLDEDALGFLEHDQAGPGHATCRVVRVKQADAEFIFQGADLAGKGRRREAEPLGRSAEMQLLRHRDETSQLPNIHGVPCSPLAYRCLRYLPVVAVMPNSGCAEKATLEQFIIFWQ